MTTLKKPISRVSTGKIREAGKVRDIIITLETPNLLYFRAKGCSKRYSLTAETCYLLAVEAEVLAKKKCLSKKSKTR
jgi:hypothetical protein